ncbi:MAG: tRNA preQ1(34) S-adenosylmethionine ribosyltransferase-isomerase QueA [Pseudomonadota bacterium]
MHLDDFDFDLPEELIALRPARPRPASRMLVADGRATTDAQVHDLPDWLRPGDMLVFNNTKVIPARLFGVRRRETMDGSGEAQVEVTLIHRESATEWTALAKPARRLAPGDRIAFDQLSATVAARDGGKVQLVFDRGGADLDAAIATEGVMPLPPYIAGRRQADEQDRDDYQTVFAEKPGSVAAPTASLHFDQNLLDRLAARGVLSARVTLHVGAGTFLPVTTEKIEDHRMHAEWGEVPPDAAASINAARAAGGRIIPVGTTALRLIESAAAPDGTLAPYRGETDIFIRPGYRFRVADGLMTNFHLPKSTLMMLVSALMGIGHIREIYGHAIRHRYRFFSYGDSSLLLPELSARKG